MASATILGLSSLDSRVTLFVVELYSDSGLTTLVDTQTVPAFYDITTGTANQVGALAFDGLTSAGTYYARSCTVAPGFGVSAWSASLTVTASTDPTPATPYTTTSGSTPSGYWVKDSNGYIRQWGRITSDINNTETPVAFPTAFTTVGSISISVTTFSTADRITYVVNDGSLSTTGFSVDNNGSSGYAMWQADGY